MSTLKIYEFEQYELDLLQKSEEDIKYGRVISQEDLDREDLEWLSNQKISKTNTSLIS